MAARVRLAGGPADRARLAEKAKEYVRRISVRMSQGLGEAEICRPAVCLELAATTLGLAEPPPRAQFQMMSGAPEKVYRKNFLMMQKLLGLSSRVTARQLVEQFGCVRLEPSVERTLKAFKERYVQALPPAERARADFGRPVFIAAVFWLLAKKSKVPRVDRDDILRLAVADEAEFGRAVNSVNELCFDMVGVAKQKKRAGDVKRNRELLDIIGTTGGQVEDGILDPTALSSKDAAREEAAKWRERVLTEIRERPAAAQGPPKKAKQATLSFAPAAGK
eukprot:jgi/Tetstr1/458498/TSEL_044904.t1